METTQNNYNKYIDTTNDDLESELILDEIDIISQYITIPMTSE